MSKRVPLIDSYDSFIEFNSKLKTKSYSIAIYSVDYEKNKILIKTTDINHLCQYDLDYFMWDFVTRQAARISSNIDLLSSYDFAKIYSRTHPKIFKKRIEEYSENLLLLNASTFVVCDFEVERIGTGLKVLRYVGVPKDELLIPYGIVAIGEKAFEDCTWLKSITLPPTLKAILSHAFADCYHLETVEIPDSVEIIDDYAFLHCESLKHFKFPKSLFFIGSSAFSGAGLEEIRLPNTLETLCGCAFKSCEKLKKVVLPDGLKFINVQVFYDTGIESIEIPDSVIDIGSRAFAYCYNLEEVKLSNSLEIIRQNAFMYADIKEIIIPDTIKRLGDGAFHGCNKLNKVRMPKNKPLKRVEYYLNSNNPKSVEKIPNTEILIGEGVFRGTPYESAFTI